MARRGDWGLGGGLQLEGPRFGGGNFGPFSGFFGNLRAIFFGIFGGGPVKL